MLAVWQRVFREAGHPIGYRNVERFMHTTHIRRHANDNRRMDLISSGIDGIYNVAPLFMDATIVSPLHGNGLAMGGCANQDEKALERANDKNKPPIMSRTTERIRPKKEPTTTINNQ